MRKNFPVRALAVLLIVFGFISISNVAAAWAEAKVIAVPANAANPSIPHLAYNGHKTTLKAIARGLPDATSARYRWDTNGDGSFTDEVERVPGRCLSGAPDETTCYDLSQVILIPTQATSRLFRFTVRLSIPGKDDVFATYPVYVRADVPAQPDPENNGSALPQNATEKQLEVMRSVALDDALWYQHLQITDRAGSGAAITGSITGGPGIIYAKAAAALLLFEKTGHRPTYPPGTYSGASPAGFTENNDSRWNNDPYSEDAIRLFNYLVSNLAPAAIYAEDESDDGRASIPGTNDGLGLNYFPSQYSSFSAWANGTLPLAAISYSGLARTAAQTGNATYVLGKPIEFIVQQMVDFVTYAQIDYMNSSHGGWWYYPNESVSMNHEDFVRGVFIGLAAAQYGMGNEGVYVNNRLRSRASSYFKYNQDPATKLALFYQKDNSYCTGTGLFTETGDSLIALGFLGWNQYSTGDTTVLATDYAGLPITRGQARQMFNDSINALGTNWLSFQTGCQNWTSGLFYNDGGTNLTPYLRTDRMGNIHAMFGIAEAVSNFTNAPDYNLIGGHNWKREFSIYLIRNQFDDGYWLDTKWPDLNPLMSPDTYGPALSTSYAALILASAPLLDPVAVGSASPLTVTEGCSSSSAGTVSFGHADSFHRSANHQIVDYQWIFDAGPYSVNWGAINWAAIPNNGYSPDGKAFHSNDPNAMPSYRYTRAGAYKAALRVVDDNNPGKTDELQIAITVQEAPRLAPIADAGGPYLVELGSGLSLDGSRSSDPNDLCGDSIVSFAWDLNQDGVTDASGEEPLLTPDKLNALGIGTHTIRLTVTDLHGLTGSAQTAIRIEENKPVAVATASQSSVGCGVSVTFDGSGSYHGSSNRSIVGYEWDFDYNGAFTADAAGVRITHLYSSLGTHTTALRVIDNNDPAKTAIATVTTTVAYANVAPTANAGGPYVIDHDAGLTLYGSASDPNEACGDRIVSYSWDLNGDGTADATGATLSLNAQQRSVLGIGVGSHTLRLTATDAQGLSGTATAPLTVYDNRPIASVAAAPAGTVGCSVAVTFSGSLSRHGSPNHSIVNYEWDFDYSGAFVTDATGIQTSHTYLTPGTHTTALRVTDDNVPPKAAIGTVTTSVNFTNVAPTANAGGPYSVVAGNGITLNGAGSTDPNAPCDAIVAYEWRIGQLVLTGATPSLSAAQISTLGPGAHPLTLTVTDAFSLTASATTSLTIEVQAVQIYRITGTAYIYPETTALRASFSIETTSDTVPGGSLKYYYAKTRMNFASTVITSVTVNGKSAVINGTGTVNGVGGYTFSASVTDGVPDSFGITILKSNGSNYYSVAPKNVAGGTLLIYAQ